MTVSPDVGGRHDCVLYRHRLVLLHMGVVPAELNTDKIGSVASDGDARARPQSIVTPSSSTVPSAMPNF